MDVVQLSVQVLPGEDVPQEGNPVAALFFGVKGFGGGVFHPFQLGLAVLRQQGDVGFGIGGIHRGGEGDAGIVPGKLPEFFLDAQGHLRHHIPRPDEEQIVSAGKDAVHIGILRV